ncbi:MAG TPA: alpha-2-macroglobulin family protein [Candidatus Pacearchaeota archaeon]|nr:Ig-like domain-containing protein [Candidatus Parcubacteria bacterium]HOC53516.1 alpha-2-macroglobulin family protein [Candidatus Pacearchaeota archaeon]HQM24410.1 alpha-2-macroglobulin family protein [Candidatus Pacearchaeota archaeon]
MEIPENINSFPKMEIQNINTFLKKEELPKEEKKKRFNFSRSKIILFSLIALLISGIFFVFWTRDIEQDIASQYRLVPEKISISAPIKIYLPKGTNLASAKQNTVFDPKIEGQWIEESNAISSLFNVFASEEETDVIIFKPNQPLKLDRYYSVEISLDENKKIKSDFLAVEDPSIVAIFPKEDSEASEDSKISIVFNRPMVPLTTLDELSTKDIPVEITPKTEGKFKWISTNTLQFIPNDRLQRATNYKVKVSSGLISIDGLSVSSKEASFTTRKLRYASNYYNDTQVYNEPVRVYFNQPVDIEKIKNEIIVHDNTNNKDINFIVKYYKKTDDSIVEGSLDKNLGFFEKIKRNIFLAFNYVKRNLIYGLAGLGIIEKWNDSLVEKSVLEIYPQKDKFNRKELWDFDSNYTIKINKAYPFEGDINLNESKNISFTTTGIISSIDAESNRTSYSNKDFFDPKGRLIVKFYEDVNLSKSEFSASVYINKTEYGQKCENGTYGNNCKKVEDKKTIYFTFNDQAISPGQVIDLNFIKIVNTSGLKINGENINQKISVYNPLEVSIGEKELTRIVFCSNNPLIVPAKEDLQAKITANLDYRIFYWENSYKPWWNSGLCSGYNFITEIKTGFIPESQYVLNLDIEDVFGQKVSKIETFKTGKMEDSYTELYSLQNRYSITSPEDTKFNFGYSNITYVNLSICKVSPLNFYTAYSSDQLTYDCQERKNEKIGLKESYWANNYFQLNIADYFEDPIGNYVIKLDNPDLDKYTRDREILYVSVTNLAVARKKIDIGGNISELESLTSNFDNMSDVYWVTDIKTQQPISKAVVKNYRDYKLVETVLTDENGVALAKPSGDLLTIVENGKDSTLIMNSNLNWVSDAVSVKKQYIYTDKPIYRPNEKINIKGILRIGYDGNYELISGNKTISLYGPRNNNPLSQKVVTLSAFGTFNADFTLPTDTPLGDYRVCVDKYSFCANFSILEYIPAPFEVKLTPDKEEYISKDNIEIQANGNYYFGVPVQNGEVEYTVSSQNYYFDKYDGWCFGSCSYDYYWYSYDDYYSYGDKFISRNKTTLDENGKALITEKIDLQDIFKDTENIVGKIIVIDATVKNSFGQAVSAQSSVIVHPGDFYLAVNSEPSFIGKNQDFTLKAKSVTTEGKELSVKNIKAEIYRKEWVYSKRQGTSGSYNYVWEMEKELIKEFNFNTDKNGNYSTNIKLDKEGHYEILITGFDKKGNKIIANNDIYVYGEGSASVKTETNAELQLRPKTINLEPGDKGELIIESPYSKSKALIAIERGKIFEYHIVDIVGNLYNFQFDVKEEYGPNFYISVLLQSSDPEVKFASQEFKVDSDKNKINIEIKSDKNFYSPGDEIKLSIYAKDYKNKPVAGEFSIAVVDLSVLALKGNVKKDPLVFFYGGFPLTVSTSSNIKNILVKQDISYTKGGSGGGQEDSFSPRGDFRDVAFWQADVVSNNDGYAEVVFKLPDNLTTWQAEVLGVTKDTKLGVDYLSFMSKKELMLVPLKPRFIIPGDEFYVGAKIFNQSENKEKFKINFSSDNLQLLEKAEIQKIIDKNKEETVYFKVKAPENIVSGSHNFTIIVEGGNMKDGVKNEIAINANLTYETTATSNYTTNNNVKEVIYVPTNVSDKYGEVTIKTSATLAVFLSDALNYLIQYPYGCSEQIASRLKPMAIIKAGLNIPNIQENFKLKKVVENGREYTLDQLIDIGLNEIYKNQNSNGGFSLWGDGRESYYTTLKVIDMMVAMKKANVAINENSFNRGLTYLYDKFNNSTLSLDSKIVFASVLLSSDQYKNNASIKSFIESTANNDKIIKDNLSNKTLSELAVILNSGNFKSSIVKKVNDVLDNRIDIDSRGAFLEKNKNNTFYDYYETPIANTAIYLKSVALGKRETSFNDKLLRWIINSKKKDGAWGSTQNTISVIEAFTEYLKWKKETSVNFVLETKINNEGIDSFNFNPSNILEQRSTTLGIDKLNIGEYNEVDFSKESKSLLGGKESLYYDMSFKYYLQGVVPARDEGFTITRNFYTLDDVKNEKPLESIKTGEVFREHLEIIVPKTSRNVAIEDFIPAGVEIVDLSLATEQKSLRFTEIEVDNRILRPDFKELRDDRAFLYKEYLSPGVYEFDYYVRALVKGKYIQLPGIVSEFYEPENFGRTSSSYFEVK